MTKKQIRKPQNQPKAMKLTPQAIEDKVIPDKSDAVIDVQTVTEPETQAEPKAPTPAPEAQADVEAPELQAQTATIAELEALSIQAIRKLGVKKNVGGSGTRADIASRLTGLVTTAEFKALV